MWRNLENRERERRELDKIYRERANLRLKYWAIGLGILTTALIAGATFTMDYSWTLTLILRGAAGLCAIVFSLLTTILVYRANRTYWGRRNNSRRSGVN